MLPSRDYLRSDVANTFLSQHLAQYQNESSVLKT